jgi:serine/threonine protein kinase/tetratricopeptide (TPR) repeat protein
VIGRTVSHYKIIEKLGEGGMGVVYKAEDSRLQRIVAIKFLSHAMGKFAEEDRTRFYREARAASLLDHPNIETIYEIDDHQDESFIVMGYVDGGTLQQKIEQSKLKIEEVLDLALQIADGLQAAHDKGLVHRDIKSANIMVTSKGQAKIVDFGLAKLKQAERLTQTGHTSGTLSYMAPEQMKGEPMDHRSDIWSFGVVLYEMLTGELPFKGTDQGAVVYAVVHEPPQAPSHLDRRIPPALDAIVKRLLEKDPGARYPSMEEVSRSLRTTRSGMDASAHAGRTKAIAVLPFDNISPDKESDYFGTGLTEELIANLSRLTGVRVVSRTTSMQYRGTTKDAKTIGRELGVRYIVEGSVRKFQDNLRITAQLIEVESDTQLWAETYKGKLADVFDIQEQVAKQIVDALLVKLTPTEKVVLTKRSTLSAEAFDCALRARNFLYRLTKANVQFAVQLFQRAIELDPRYAAAYAGLGEAYGILFQVFDRKNEWLDKAIEAGLKALMYDASLSEAYSTLGFAYFNKREYDDALTASRKAIELDPNNVSGLWILGRIYLTSDRFREAAELLQRVLALNPEFYSAFIDLQVAYGRLGEDDKVKATDRALFEMLPGYLSSHPDDVRAHLFYASALVSQGKFDDARTAVTRALAMSPGDPLMLYNGACTYARMGDNRLALDTLTEAVAAGYEFREWIERDPDFDGLRREPEFVALMKRLAK